MRVNFVEFAEYYAKLGLAVIPLQVKQKKPVFQEWQNKATVDLDTIREWWSGGKSRYRNIGVAMGQASGIIAIDLDKAKEDGVDDGEVVFQKYAEMHGVKIPDTWAFQTGRGGKQLLFRTDEDIPNFVGILTNVDVRGNNGYSMMPPSLHPNGNFYKWVPGRSPEDIPDGPAELPDFLLRLFEEKREIVNHFEIPEKIQDGKRNDTLFKMACSLRANGYLESEILATLKAVNDGRCEKPLSDKELESICGSAAKYERGASKKKKSKKINPLEVQSVRELQDEDLPPIRWIVNDLIPQGLTLLASPPKYGKSWWVLDLCLAVSAGENFMGRSTERCGCLYLALEDSKNRLQERINRLTYNESAPDGFDYAIMAASLREGFVEQLEEYINQRSEAGLIIIDTLQKVRSSSTRGESAYAADYKEVSMIKNIADKYSIAILLVHHLKKGSDGDVFDRISGTNGIFGSVDTAIVMERNNRKDKETLFHITGRDVNSDDLLIEFDPDSCRWKCQGSFDEIEERRLTTEYETDPLVGTIKHLLENSSAGVWKGIASELFEACLDYTGTPPAENEKVLGKRIRTTAKFLWLRDQIYYIPPGKNGGAGGRKHTFRRVKKKNDKGGDSVVGSGEKDFGGA